MRLNMQQNMIGHNIIITEPSSNLRALGRNALAGKWKIAIIAYIVYLLCIQIPPAVFDTFFGINISDIAYQYAYGSGEFNADLYNQINNTSPDISPLSGIYTMLVTGPFCLGITIFFLALFRKQDVILTDIFLGFERFGKALGLLLFEGLFILLWALIGVAVMMLGGIVMAFTLTGGTVIVIIGAVIAAVFAVIASLKYSQAFFILSDDPEKGIRQCVDESKMMMKGNKAKLFWLQLSFIGWLILSCIPMGILTGIAQATQMSAGAVLFIDVIAGLFIAPVQVYFFSASTGFYEILAGHLIKETEPAPLSSESGDMHISEHTVSETVAHKDEVPEYLPDEADSSEKVTLERNHGHSSINPREIMENSDENEHKEV